MFSELREYVVFNMPRRSRYGKSRCVLLRQMLELPQLAELRNLKDARYRDQKELHRLSHAGRGDEPDRL